MIHVCVGILRNSSCRNSSLVFSKGRSCCSPKPVLTNDRDMFMRFFFHAHTIPFKVGRKMITARFQIEHVACVEPGCAITQTENWIRRPAIQYSEPPFSNSISEAFPPHLNKIDQAHQGTLRLLYADGDGERWKKRRTQAYHPPLFCPNHASASEGPFGTDESIIIACFCCYTTSSPFNAPSNFFYVYLPRLFDSKKRWCVHNMNDDAYYQKLKGYYTVKCYFLSRRFESDGEDQGGENSQQTCTGSQR